MAILWVVVGAVIGVVISSAGRYTNIDGVVWGAALGFVLFQLKSTSSRLHVIEQAYNELTKPEKASKEEESTAPLTAFEPEPVAASEPIPQKADASDGPEDFKIEYPTTTPYIKQTAQQHATIVPNTGPSGVSRILDAVKEFMTTGSIAVKTGVVVLFFGVSFLLKYAADHALFPIELRLISSALGGLALLAIGWRVRHSRQNYALVIQGGGVGILYLTTFAALRLYALIPPTLAFAILVAIAALSAALAILQDSPTFAVLGVSGGFLAPVLTSTGGGHHVVLFSYYALLNASIIIISWFRAWRVLNVVGFVFTFGIGTLWGVTHYSPENFSTSEPFLILFFLMYVFVAVLFALRQPVKLKGYIDGTLVFGAPVVSFALQAKLVKPYEYGMAWSALLLGLFYIALAWILFLKRPHVLRMLSEAFLAFGIVFGTLAIPLAFDGRWTAAAWSLEGIAILWVGIRQQKLITRIFGVLLYFCAGVAFLSSLDSATGSTPVLNGFFLGCLLISVTGLFASFYIFRKKELLDSRETLFCVPLFAWGLIWWFGGCMHEIHRHAALDYHMSFLLLLTALTCGFFYYIKGRLAWPLAAYPGLGLLPAVGYIAAFWAASHTHPFAGAGFIAWPVALAVHYRILYRQDDRFPGYVKFLHAGALWLACILCAWELNWQVNNLVEGAGTWGLIAWGIVPSLFVMAVSKLTERPWWPIGGRSETYITLGAGPVVLAAYFWALYSNVTSNGDPWPLPYLPFLNPLDIAVGFVFIALPVWFMALRRHSASGTRYFQLQSVLVVYLAGLFVWLNAILVRVVYHWGGVDFSYSAMFNSTLFQASLSIFWGLLALCTMVFSTRRGIRPAWAAGAGLLAAIVIKLFLVDLSNTGTVARIVSFVGAGVLLLIVGYMSPVPPRVLKETEQ